MSAGDLWQLWINDEEDETLTFDLRDVLRALGPAYTSWIWTVSGVGEWKGALSYGMRKELIYDEELMATGAGATELEAIAKVTSKIAGRHLLEIAERTDQVIWGEFSGFRQNNLELPWIRIIAVDGSWFEVLCEDRALLEHAASAFSDTTLTSPPITLPPVQGP